MVIFNKNIIMVILMEKEEFYKMLDSKQYKELEEKLKEEYGATEKLEAKYQLGICYGEQFEKIENAKKIFKELMNTDFRPPYIYSFNAKHTRGDTEKMKIINEGLRIYPDSSVLNNQLLFCLDDDEKEQYYKELDEKGILQVSSIMKMISYYFEREAFAKASRIFKDKKIQLEDTNFNIKDIDLIRILSCYLNDEEVNLDEISSLVISDNNSINETILRLVEIDVVLNKNVVKAKNYCNKLITDQNIQKIL